VILGSHLIITKPAIIKIIGTRRAFVNCRAPKLPDEDPVVGERTLRFSIGLIKKAK